MHYFYTTLYLIPLDKTFADKNSFNTSVQYLFMDIIIIIHCTNYTVIIIIMSLTLGLQFK